jgi:hypothetical protein
MSRHPHQELPEKLRDLLRGVGDELSVGRPPGDRLGQAIADLDQLDAEAATWAANQIVLEANLYRWRRPRPGTLRTGSERTPFEWLLIDPRLARLFIFHGDGYVREAALNQLKEPPPSPFALAALALRLNDWVEEVRLAARRCAVRTFPSTPADVVIASATFLLDRRVRWKRWSDTDAAIIDALVDRPEVAKGLAQRFAGPGAGPLATELRHALRRASLNPYLDALARFARTPAVRAAALDTLIRGQARWPDGFDRQWIDKRFNLSRRVVRFAERPLSESHETEPLIWRGLNDKAAAVRRVAADAVIAQRHSYEGLNAVVATLLQDPRPSLRERGEFLRRHQSEPH